jgi:hypothetical protein
MVEERDEFMKEQLSALRDRDGVHDLDPVLQQLQSDLNIHVAVGAGVIYGYHVGGVDSKWHYVIDGPAMQQVRSADLDPLRRATSGSTPTSAPRVSLAA